MQVLDTELRARVRALYSGKEKTETTSLSTGQTSSMESMRFCAELLCTGAYLLNAQG